MAGTYYPPVGFHFKVDVNGKGNGGTDLRFQEVSGLSAEITIEELQVGGINAFSYKLPVKAKYPNLILKRGMLTDSNLIKWFKDAIENFIFDPTLIYIYLLNEDHQTISTWEFTQAYPIKWAISDFKAQENSLVVETIEIAYQFFQRK
ncbi:phage tail protein [Pinibacter aurantiacus]|uniref:Phage tail protein n=1 Tax=Pinibacter aurantiacus TaxID=2851599 RepID=A0A9E2SFG5_9BACT|nr:phage tail protein [Pinibacter aurantiacus]MBV4360538.1 phage tail protein [Pinibacter aurantiacus]